MSEPTATTHSDGQAGFRFAPGTVLAERYVVERGLGRGGMGEVYQVRDTALGEVVALKMLSARLASDAVALSRFQGEVRTARQVGHPNVCRTYEFGVHKDERGETAHFLTMELLTGETLASRLSRDRLGRAEVLDLLGQVAAAIDAAHAAGIVHRDLKPANVMLVGHSGGGTRAVVTDFGLARQVDESRVTHEGWVGTPAYVAPEQLAGEAGGPAADVYAFGVMLFEAATGRLPFEGATGPQVALQRMARPAPRARTVDATLPAEWDEAIARCLEKEPAARFTYAGDAVRAMGGEVPGVRTSSSAVWSRGAGRRGRLALAGLAVLAIAGGATLLVVRQRSRAPALPGANRVVAVTVQPAAGTSAPQLPADLPPFDEAAAYVVRDQLRTLEEPRRFRVSDDRQGNVEARLEWAQRGPAMTGRLTVAAVGGPPIAHFEAEAPSIRELAIALYPRLAEVAGAGQPPVELFPDERAEMERWAAPDPQAFKQLKRLLVDYWSEFAIDSSRLKAGYNDVLKRHPGWPHAVLAAALDLALTSKEAKALAARHLQLTPPGSDPLGRELLAHLAAGDVKALASPTLLDRAWPRQDLLVDLVLSGAIYSTGSDDDFRAAHARLAQRYPSLQWSGLEVTPSGKAPSWHFLAAGNRQAWLSAITALALGPGPSPRPALEWFRRLQGELPQTLVTVTALHLVRFELDEIRQLTPTLLTSPAILRATGLVLLGQSAIFEGRLRAARERHLQALEAARAGQRDTQFFWTQNMRELLRLSLLLGDARGAGEYRRLLEVEWANFGWPPSTLAAYRWEAARDAKGGCPPLPSAPPGASAMEREALRLARRAARAAACGDCASVLADGPSVSEDTLPWTDVFARCAVESGSGLEEALRMLRGGEHYASTAVTNSPDASAVDVVLSHYWMGRVLERQGKPGEARSRYLRFLQFWGDADVPLAEVADARKRLLALPAADPPR